MAFVDDEEEPEELMPAEIAEERRLREVERLTAQALSAARIGQCEVARSLEVRLRGLEPGAASVTRGCAKL
jgi:hypothetical protein